VKQDAIAGYAGRVELCAPTMDAREAGAARIQAATGAEYISPYNDARVMAGQGTMALELLEQARACRSGFARCRRGGCRFAHCQDKSSGRHERYRTELVQLHWSVLLPHLPLLYSFGGSHGALLCVPD